MRDSDQTFFYRVFEMMMATSHSDKLPAISFNNFYDLFTVQGRLRVIGINIIYHWRYNPSDKKQFPCIKLVCLLLAAFVLIWSAGFRVNLTASLPLGVYQLTDAEPKLGDTVFFCLESEAFINLAKAREYVGPGACPGGIRALGKEVYGLPGDNIGIEADGSISINGRVIAGSAARRRDSRGRPIPAPLLQAGIVPPGRALALALRNPGSFDGRYFGLTSLAGMQVVRPVWIFE